MAAKWQTMVDFPTPRFWLKMTRFIASPPRLQHPGWH
jgi:hypothetical protein